MGSTSIREGLNLFGVRRSVVKRGGVYYRTFAAEPIWNTPYTKVGIEISNETLRRESVEALGALILALQTSEQPVETTTPEGFIGQFAVGPHVASRRSAIVSVSRQPGHQTILTEVQEVPDRHRGSWIPSDLSEPRVVEDRDKAIAYAEIALDDIITSGAQISVPVAPIEATQPATFIKL